MPSSVVDSFVVIALAVYALPFFWQLLTSFKPEAELLRLPPLLPSRLTAAHYGAVFTRSTLPRALLNSLGIATVTTVLALALGLPAAYALARLPRDRGLHGVPADRHREPAVSARARARAP
jgi:multiple sugar transport system permease protein